MSSLTTLLSLGAVAVQASPQWHRPPPPPHHNNSSPLLVDLGYAQYQGFQETTDSRMNAWMGIRYAAPPTGNQRWRPPQAPRSNRSQIIQADAAPPRCPQSFQSPASPGLPYTGDEDCLFLNVFAPEGARNLPVFFNIHGGGYGAGAAAGNFDQLTQVNDYGFVSVAIQYRLESFGFLASTAVQNDGTANAGLLDQHFALQWVQQHISKFGGDPRRVTIAGQSAGAGSVEMQALAYGGRDGTKYFDKGIAASPYTPVLYHYNDPVPEQHYLRLAQEVGCYNGSTTVQRDADSAILRCLRNADSAALQTANFNVGGGINYGSWAFVPAVVDGGFIQDLPSNQLVAGRVNGRMVLTSHNSNEGAEFVDPTIKTADDFNKWLLSEYPDLTQRDIDQINNVYYPYKDESDVPFATCGNCGGPNAINVGTFATGHQQRAIEFYSEATFDCPSYWLAGSYSGWGKAGYKYIFSIPSGKHGLDQVAESLIDYPNGLVPNIGSDLHIALTTAWGNFIKTGNPSISNLLANGNSTGDTSPNPASHWPEFNFYGRNSWQAINLNQTGGVLYYGFPQVGGLPTAAQYMDPGLMNNFTQVNGYTWEGGIGRRCDFLRSIGSRIPV
ncbi:hypothetical protein PRZ48_007347 [Zasmidium cellare]|uniref:Carboxylic ester hydrolase n=1 Tax=Zasmidium cellare TaxID=395010 RepID=A0ABR0EK73_ZASCE|nr:hypothetical protein PRZ48_007347 [Zasmidium cellare]